MVFEQKSRVIINTITGPEEDRQRTVIYWPHGHTVEMVCCVGGSTRPHSGDTEKTLSRYTGGILCIVGV